jgi:iron(III) transport system substrate-binding protein
MMNETSDGDRRGSSGAEESTRRLTRRHFVAAASAAGIASIAGCLGGIEDPEEGTGDPTALTNFRGSGPLVEERGPPGGTSITDLPDLTGELKIYLGGGEGGLYLELIDRLKAIYPDFETEPLINNSSGLANTIIEETNAGTSPADIFLSVDAGSLVAVSDAGATTTLPGTVTEPALAKFRTDNWVGIAGRARSMPYNTDELAGSDLPDTVQDLPEMASLSSEIGWAPTYGAFQSFVTAMRLTRGEEQTRQWLLDMKDHGTQSYDNEFFVSSAVADGEITTGFANHYYALRVLNSREDAPIDLHFTSGDAGALINVSGASIIEGSDSQDLAETFIRHLLSAEAQEFFATRAFAYPTVPDVTPVGGLPTIDELSPPDVDLTRLSDIQPTLELLRDTDVL